MTELPEHEVPDEVETDDWTLTIRGLVGTPREFDVDDLASLPTETFAEEFDCAAGWTAEGISWRGVRVGDLLGLPDPAPESQYALVRAMDGEYACSFPLTRLASAVLALELDGEPLPTAHGGPARLVPTDDGDCWESVKWVDAIELTAEPPGDTAREIALDRVE